MRIPGPIRAASVLLSVLTVTAFAAAGCGSDSDVSDGTAPPNPPASTSTTPHRGEAPQGARAQRCDRGAGAGVEIRVTGVSCSVGRDLVADWHAESSCWSPPGASRTSCRLGRLTCLGANSGRGIAVTCAGLGRSVAFIGRRPG